MGHPVRWPFGSRTWAGFADEVGRIRLQPDVEEVPAPERECVALIVDEGIFDADLSEEVLGLRDTDFDDFVEAVPGWPDDLVGVGGHELPRLAGWVGNEEFSFRESALFASDEVVELASQLFEFFI